MTQDPVRTGVDRRRTRHDDHPERPEPPERRDRPPLEEPWRPRTPSGPRRTIRRPADARTAPSAIIATNSAGIGDLHQLIDIVGGFDAAARPLRALVRAARRASTSMKAATTKNNTSGNAELARRFPSSFSASSAASAFPPVTPGRNRRRGDERSQDRWQIPCAGRRQTHGDRRADQAAQRAVESPLGAELPAAPRREPIVDAGPAVRERAKRGLRGEFAAADGEAQAVAGHRIDEAGGVAGEQQASAAARRAASTASGPSTDRRATSRARAKRSRSSGSPPARSCTRRADRADRLAARGGLHQTDVGQPVGHRRHADVAAAPDVHLAELRHARRRRSE